MTLSARKDRLVQVYKTEKRRVLGKDKSYRRFIYSIDQYNAGGLWANARELMGEEKVRNNLAYENTYVQFIVNRNPRITTGCIIIYDNNTYAIESTDNLDFRSRDMKIKAKLIKDNNKYIGDLYMNNRFQTQELAVGAFTDALTDAGMQPSYGDDATKPRYWRGFVDKDYATEPLFLRFIVDNNEIPYSADNYDFLQEVEIGGEVYTNNGYEDEDYIDLCLAIEAQMQNNNIEFQWLGEDSDASFDVDNPIRLKRFTAKIIT